MWIVLLIQKIYVCGHDLAWEKLAAPQCKLGTAVAGTELSCESLLSNLPHGVYSHTSICI